VAFLRSLGLAGALLIALFGTAGPTGAAAPGQNATSTRRPNIVFFLIDDLGYMDIGANNPDTFYETPNVDQLARDGMRFTHAYAANPVCSPTRYSILTGKYPTRAGATNWFSGTRAGRFRPAPLVDRMPLEEVTLAEALKADGYHTAFVGKWHLGPTEAFWPEAQGFDVNIGGHHAGSPPGGYFGPFKNPRLSPGAEGEHLTARLADEAVGLVDRFRAQPFFLYVAFYTVHTPLQAPPSLLEKYRAKAAARTSTAPDFAPEEQVWPTNTARSVRTVQNHPTFAAMVESMDAATGRVLTAIRDAGLDDNTVVVFTSDNGGLSTAEGSPTSNLPFRGGKGWVYEGGIREPLIVKWPGVTRPGSTSDTPVISTDFYPTLLDIAGLPPRPDQHLDGLSLTPLLRDTGTIGRDALLWHYPHYSNQGGFPGGAIRVGTDKLIERYEDGRVHLYDLARDPGERDDLAEARSGRVAELRRRLHGWYREVGARFLEPVPGGPAPWRP
jgi:arylsulfatase A-like enzyme